MPVFKRMFGDRPASATTRANRRSRKPDNAPDALEEIPAERKLVRMESTTKVVWPSASL